MSQIGLAGVGDPGQMSTGFLPGSKVRWVTGCQLKFHTIAGTKARNLGKRPPHVYPDEIRNQQIHGMQ